MHADPYEPPAAGVTAAQLQGGADGLRTADGAHAAGRAVDEELTNLIAGAGRSINIGNEDGDRRVGTGLIATVHQMWRALRVKMIPAVVGAALSHEAKHESTHTTPTAVPERAALARPTISDQQRSSQLLRDAVTDEKERPTAQQPKPLTPLERRNRLEAITRDVERANPEPPARERTTPAQSTPAERSPVPEVHPPGEASGPHALTDPALDTTPEHHASPKPAPVPVEQTPAQQPARQDRIDLLANADERAIARELRDRWGATAHRLATEGATKWSRLGSDAEHIAAFRADCESDEAAEKAAQSLEGTFSLITERYRGPQRWLTAWERISHEAVTNMALYARRDEMAARAKAKPDRDAPGRGSEPGEREK